jgi:hypothetical protein
MEHDERAIGITNDPLERFLALSFRHVFFNDGTHQLREIVLNDFRLSIRRDRYMVDRVIDDE